MLIDSHCHLTDPQFSQDRREVLLRAREAGVEKVLSVCSNRGDEPRWRALLEEAAGIPGAPGVWGTAGIHPHEAREAREGDLSALGELARTHPRVVAVGETGLDFHYDLSPREAQESLFREHLEVGAGLGLPVVVHSRSADTALIRILREWEGRVQGVLHCFTGGEELLGVALAMGWMVSFTGIITFKNFDGGEVVRSVPQDRLMVETDAPYLAPIPHRGRRNEPAFVTRVAEALAAIRGEESEEVKEYTTDNAIRFFSLND